MLKWRKLIMHIEGDETTGERQEEKGVLKTFIKFETKSFSSARVSCYNYVDFES